MKIISFILSMTLSFHAFSFTCSLKEHQVLGKEVIQELQNLDCKGHAVHLTFDDGPSPEVTPEILKILKERNIKSTFFITTTNLDTNHPHYLENQALVREEMNEGHLIGDHGYEHNAYDLRLGASGNVLEAGFSPEEREEQIHKSVRLLNEATNKKFSKQKNLLFRLPYGRGAMPSARELEYMQTQGEIRFSDQNYAQRLSEYRGQSPALIALSQEGFSHLGWNNDSGDSSFGFGIPSNEALKSHIVKNLKSMCSGPSLQVALFHDIKPMNTVVLPLVIDIGKCLGISFISSDEMLATSAPLVERGVLLKKKEVTKQQIKTIDDILSSISQSGTPGCSEVEEKSCYSEQYKKRYQECEGGDSVCYDGKWFSRHDPNIILNCNLTD